MSNRQIVSKVTQIDKAIRHVKSNLTVLCGGFGLCGIPETLFGEIAKRPEITGLICVSNNAGLKGKGLDKLVGTGQVKKLIMSYLGNSKTLNENYLTGKIEVELTPQGTIAERLRAAASGAPAIFTATGADSWIEHGRMPVKYSAEGKVEEYSQPKQVFDFNGRKYLLEYALPGDVALIKCWKADPAGNLVFRASTQNFNVVMAKAAKITLVEAEEIVELGEIQPHEVHVPGIHVTHVVQSTAPKYVEIEKFASNDSASVGGSREVIARRCAKEFKTGMYANLGTGLPTLVPSFISEDIHVTFESENGLLGVGPYPKDSSEVDSDLINAGKEAVTLLPGASVFDSTESFCLIRSGKIDITVLGAMQVSQFGDLANWGVPGNIKGMGGAMDLVSNPQETRVIVTTTHTTKTGESKIVEKCEHPLTGSKCVSRIITELCVFDAHPEHGLTLVDLQPGVTEEEVKAKTAAPYTSALLPHAPKL